MAAWNRRLAGCCDRPQRFVTHLDILPSVLFYAFAIVALAGAFAAILLAGAAPRAVGLVAVAVGTAGMLAALSAGFVAAVALVSLGACAALLTNAPAPARFAAPGRAGNLGAVGASLLFLVLALAGLRSPVSTGSWQGDWLGATAVGRLLFTRDALSAEAVAAMMLIALAAARAAWRGRS